MKSLPPSLQSILSPRAVFEVPVLLLSTRVGCSHRRGRGNSSEVLVETSFGEERAAVGPGRGDSDPITALGMDRVVLSDCCCSR